MNNFVKSVLIIDDDVSIQSTLSTHLKCFNFNVDVTSDGESGLKIAEESHPDYIICDLMMSEMDGYEFCRKLRSNSETEGIPVMILSAKTDGDAKKMSYKNGAQAFVEKPFVGKKIATMIMLALEMELPDNDEPPDKDLNRKKSEFISAVSHELRTPMTSIKSAVCLIGDGTLGPLNEEQKDFFSLLERNVLRLTKLIDEILSFSRIESGRLTLSVADVNVNKVLSSIVNAFYLKVEENRNLLQLKVPSTDVFVRCDEEKFRMILYYLLDNAINHNPENTPVEVGVSCDGGYVRIYVKDQGQGIPSEDVDSVFDRFHQVNRQVGDGSKGIGLGLAISKGLVEAHESTLEVDSVVGEGSTFFFDLHMV